MMQSHRKWYKRTLALLLAVAMVATPATAFAQTEPAAEEPAASVVYAPEDLAAFSEALDSAGYDLPDNTAALAALSEEQPDLSTQNIQMEVSPAAPASVLRTAQSAAPQAETSSTLKIMQVSDTHLLPESMQPNGGETQQPGQFQPALDGDGNLVNTEPFEYPDFAAALHSDRKMMAESEDIDARVFEMVDEADPDVLVISGDLTKDGEEPAHREMAAMLTELRAANPNMQIYVINGNHDVNNSDATDFSTCVKDSYGTATTSAMDPDLKTTPEEFKEIYHDVSYTDAIATYTPPEGKQQGSLSYVARPAEGFTFIVMDSGKYSADVTDSGTDEHMTGGALSEDLLQWVAEQAAEANARGDVVIGVEHHGLVPHFGMEPDILGEYLADNYEEAAEALSAAGVNIVLTGHMHANDIASREINGKMFYDIETGSCVTYPSPVRTITLTRTQEENGSIQVNAQIATDLVDTVNYNGVEIDDFTAYGKNATALSGDMISGAAGNLLVRPLVEQVLAAGGTKAALTALLEQDPGDLVVSMLDEYLPHTEEDGMHVTLSGIDATLWHADGKVHGTASVSGLDAHIVIADSDVKEKLVDVLLQQVDEKVLPEGGLLDQTIEAIATSVADMQIDAEHTVMDLANYVYQGHLAGDEPQEIPDWVNTGIAQLRDVTLVNALVAAVVDCASNEASGIADALTFNASDLIKGNDGFVDNLAAALVAGMVGGSNATVGKVVEILPVTVPGVEEPTNEQKIAFLLNGLINGDGTEENPGLLTEEIKQQVGDFAANVCESFIQDDNSATGGTENNGEIDFVLPNGNIVVSGGNLTGETYQNLDDALLAIKRDTDGEGPYTLYLNKDEDFLMYEETAGLSCYYAMRNVDKPLVIDGQGHTLGVADTRPCFLRTYGDITFKNVNLDMANTTLITWKSNAEIKMDDTVSGSLKSFRDDSASRYCYYTVDLSNLSMESMEGNGRSILRVANCGTPEEPAVMDITGMGGTKLDRSWLSIEGDCTADLGTVSTTSVGGGLVLTGDATIKGLSGWNKLESNTPATVEIPAGSVLTVTDFLFGKNSVTVTGDAQVGDVVVRAEEQEDGSFFLSSPENMELVYADGAYTLQEKAPVEYPLTVHFDPRTVQIAVNDIFPGIANVTGTYQTTVFSGDEFTMLFVPTADGREIASMEINGEAQVLESSGPFSYTLTMPEGETTLDVVATVVDKSVLRAVIEAAVALQGGEEYEAAVPAVQETFDKALENAQAIEAVIAVSQAEIDEAWSGLLDAIHLLSFEAGDPAALNTLLDIVASLTEENFTTGSWADLQAAVSDAQEAIESGLKAEMDKAYETLYDALNALVYRADFAQLDQAIAEAQEIDLDEYLDLEGTKEAFTAALERALAVQANVDADQETVDQAAQALIEAMAALRKTPSKEALAELVGTASAMDTSKYTAASVSALNRALDGAQAVLADEAATEADVETVYRALSTALDNLVERPARPVSGNHGSTSANIGNAYGAAGVVSASQTVAANAYVISDTTVNFTLKRGSAYCFKMTVVNGNSMVPSFTAGNGDVLKTQFVAKVGNDYYYRVYATGTPGQSTGVYTTLPGQNAVKHCSVTIA